MDLLQLLVDFAFLIVVREGTRQKRANKSPTFREKKKICHESSESYFLSRIERINGNFKLHYKTTSFILGDSLFSILHNGVML